MGQLENHARIPSFAKTAQAQHGEEDDLASVLGVGGAYHTEAASGMRGAHHMGGLDGQSVYPAWEESGVAQLEMQRMEEMLRNAQEELRQVSARLVTIQEMERQRIAADLHDGMGQSLSLIKLSIDSAFRQIATGEPREAAQSLQLLSHRVKETIAELHRTVTDLRPPMLDDLGILSTLSWFFREFEAVWGDKKFEKVIAIKESDVPEPLKTAIFRILQEAMNNILKHSHADWIRVSMTSADGVLRFSVEDNGLGFDPHCISVRRGSAAGFGILTMLERVRSSDGILDMQSAPGRGTRIYASWQLSESAAVRGMLRPGD